MSFLLNTLKEKPFPAASKINLLPYMIKNIPITPKTDGISFKKRKAIINPITDLYEFIGPNTDNSPICIAFIEQAVPAEHKNPATNTYIQNSAEKLLHSTPKIKGIQPIDINKYE